MLQKLRVTESDRLCVQVNAYLDNKIDVASLLEDSDTKNAALEQVADLEEALSHVCLSPQNACFCIFPLFYFQFNNPVFCNNISYTYLKLSRVI